MDTEKFWKVITLICKNHGLTSKLRKEGFGKDEYYNTVQKGDNLLQRGKRKILRFFGKCETFQGGHKSFQSTNNNQAQIQRLGLGLSEFENFLAKRCLLTCP